MIKLTIGIVLAAILTGFLSGCSTTDIRLSGGVGEHQNIFDTSQMKAEVRTGDRLYSYSRVEWNDNPSDDVNDLALTGIGWSYDVFHLESAVNDEYYLINLRYEQERSWGYTYGTLKHMDKFEGGNSGTTATLGGGYEAFNGVYIGPFYEVGNQEQKFVGDTYGLELRIVN